jgi:hypothetical protein
MLPPMALSMRIYQHAADTLRALQDAISTLLFAPAALMTSHTAPTALMSSHTAPTALMASHTAPTALMTSHTAMCVARLGSACRCLLTMNPTTALMTSHNTYRHYKTHAWFGPGVGAVVRVLLLCAQRIRSECAQRNRSECAAVPDDPNANGSNARGHADNTPAHAPAPTPCAAVLASLPTEMWMHLLSFITRTDHPPHAHTDGTSDTHLHRSLCTRWVDGAGEEMIQGGPRHRNKHALLRAFAMRGYLRVRCFSFPFSQATLSNQPVVEMRLSTCTVLVFRHEVCSLLVLGFALLLGFDARPCV